MMRRFLLGIGDAFEGGEEDGAGVDLLDGDADFAEERFHLGGFVQAHEAGVDVDAAHLHAGTCEQHGEHGAVHAAGDAADDFAAAVDAERFRGRSELQRKLARMVMPSWEWLTSG
jgi:hypothetical protein